MSISSSYGRFLLILVFLLVATFHLEFHCCNTLHGSSRSQVDGTFSNPVHISSNSSSPLQQNPSLPDYYKFYSRNIEANVWGSQLPETSAIPRSGLGIFMILWTQNDVEGRQKLKRCLKSLDVFFNDRFDYPLLILHEDLPQKEIDVIKNWTRSRVEFIGRSLIDLDYLESFNRTGFKMFGWYPEYLHMIRTNIYRWPLHRALFGYRYVFKLDADASLVEEVEFDIFEHMKNRDIMGAYVVTIMDQAFVCENLYETVEDILRYNQLQPVQDLYRMPKFSTWYGFAFVFDTAFARSPAYLNTVWHFDNVHGAFKHRWGDPQLYLLTSMFLEANQTMQLYMPFHHQDTCVHVKNQDSCSHDVSSIWYKSSKRHPRAPIHMTGWAWDPRRPFAWSPALWPRPLLSAPPFCIHNDRCSNQRVDYVDTQEMAT